MTRQEKKSRGSAIIIVLVVLLGIAALGVGGYFVYQNAQQEKAAQTKAPSLPTKASPTPLSAPSPIPTADPLADWLTYSNQITFKYPKELELKFISEENRVNVSLWGPTQKPETEFYDGITLSFSMPFEIDVELKDYVDAQAEAAKIHSDILEPTKPITINGLNGYTFTAQGLGTFQNIYLYSSDKTWVVEITNGTMDPTNQGYPATVDKILSTFAFL